METKVFISYAWEEDNENDRKVKSFTQWLAVYLKKWNFDVLLDVYENHPGTRLDKFMSEGINSSHFVLCICTKTYVEKMQNTNTGVYNEISLLKEMSDSPFIIPVIEKGMFANLPSFFEGKFVSELNFETPYSQDNKNGIVQLLCTLRDETVSAKDIKSETSIDRYFNSVEKMKFQTTVSKLMNFQCQSEGKITFQYLLNGGNFKLGIPPMEFLTHWSTCGSDSIYSYKKVQNMYRIPNFKTFDEVIKPGDIDLSNLIDVEWDTSLKIGDGILWINNNNFTAIGRVLNVENCEEDEYQNKVTLQYKILNPIELSDDFIQNLDIQE
ncbi:MULTISPECIES: toll/interleukin-1 receptor domain-containing protein [Streptococcus]|uniref:toll/interleukin-1 receptor domain-containing protein n=2 Tax=Streptococcus TaxID=1301 RepID=UPI00228377E9|nr:toll/interleukin-1 receptor domain-containing protein [Streptococcus gallolyticus]MCY7194649.1 toll/interleukin-1 receptor domain-containing protein [Streptococcus gallolyticus subsp. gallolyticus]